MGITSKVVDVLTAPIWVPTWVGVVVFRWLMGRDLSREVEDLVA